MTSEGKKSGGEQKLPGEARFFRDAIISQANVLYEKAREENSKSAHRSFLKRFVTETPYPYRPADRILLTPQGQEVLITGERPKIDKMHVFVPSAEPHENGDVPDIHVVFIKLEKRDDAEGAPPRRYMITTDSIRKFYPREDFYEIIDLSWEALHSENGGPIVEQGLDGDEIEILKELHDAIRDFHITPQGRKY